MKQRKGLYPLLIALKNGKRLAFKKQIGIITSSLFYINLSKHFEVEINKWK
jgi:hypothetical protein